MAIDLEREEERLTNNLQKQLQSIKFEKEQTEKEVEDLKKQLEKMRIEQEKVIEHCVIMISCAAQTTFMTGSSFLMDVNDVPLSITFFHFYYRLLGMLRRNKNYYQIIYSKSSKKQCLRNQN